MPAKSDSGITFLLTVAKYKVQCYPLNVDSNIYENRCKQKMYELIQAMGDLYINDILTFMSRIHFVLR